VRLLLQRVSRAEVRVDGRVTGRIDRGYLLLVGLTHDDDEGKLAWMAAKVAELRLFGDAEGKMNLGLAEVDGAVLVVSQFTLYADTSRGRRPGFTGAAPADQADRLYRRVAAALEDLGVRVATGRFGAEMAVELVNDGPFTVWLDTDDR
jgi:D-tyrosyl-tRNA(Tyr) deacylase